MLLLAEPINYDGIETLFLSVEDMNETPPELIREGVDFVLQQKQRGSTILVSCGAGVNRSSAFCTAVLKEVEGLGLLEAFREVSICHHGSLPNDVVWKSFCDYYNDPAPYLDVMRLAAKNF